ncbi:ATP-binding cassette domain-containing protein [Rubrobacter tropicus]|uniref:ATP-binding cassette domain-containing protein n=1 Tax=Rubrobacter tropicus TaxID=2653851 RepID=UPI00140AB914|nr:ATP-binding cassette domain-containing protein [Rubrobacter tropicus]
MTRAIVETIGLSKRFGRQVAVRLLDVRVESGSALELLGPNGVGKTTLLKLITGCCGPRIGGCGSSSRTGKECILAGKENLKENLKMHRWLLRLPTKRVEEVLYLVRLSGVDRRPKRLDPPRTVKCEGLWPCANRHRTLPTWRPKLQPATESRTARR